MFRFKQFTVEDDRCAMKVGTDGVLLGAWAEISACESRVLDVGAGCGLVSLMLAQRFPQASITALELDAAAAEQAGENVAASPFVSQIEVVQGDYCRQDFAQPFDVIVSNPPFFEEDLLPPDAERASARHTAAGLTFAMLVGRSAELLRGGGSLQVIVPKTAQNRFHALCNLNELVLVRATDVRTVGRKEPKRVLLHFVKGGVVASGRDAVGTTSDNSNVVARNELILMENGQRSAAYSELCCEFYL